MNIYFRYFAHETIVQSFDELIDYIDNIGEIPITHTLISELTEYLNSNTPYPKRYKVRPRVHFILIKTHVSTLEQFKANRRNNVESDAEEKTLHPELSFREERSQRLLEHREGWYLGRVNFKRVILVPGTHKFQYRDTRFSAYVRAQSGQHCYTRISEYLRSRLDIDGRSQIPSPKGHNFDYEYLGPELPNLENELPIN